MSYDEERPERKSKGQQKREAEAAQALGRELVELPLAQFKTLQERVELPERLHAALVDCRAIKAHGALRRQMQYIGKLMRDVELEPIQKTLEQVKRGGQVATAQLHQLERWRERLLTEGQSALDALLQASPNADANHLQELIASAHREAAHNQPPRAARLLFKYLRDLLVA